MTAPRIDPKYELVRKLREGGMGAIYLVRHRLLDELRVVKVLRSQLNTDEDLRQRFLREARTAIQLRHPNIAQLYDFSVDEEGNASIVLEYIDGLTLEEFGRQPEARDLAARPGDRAPGPARARLPAPQGVRPPRHLAGQPHAHPRPSTASRWSS